ncbi:MAG: D-alanyl-D-alanine carboxypeptidase/D-alanyl-D-alanine-endopeptidase [Gammaproteobacteria bacterium]|nr:D-alanyl-D-alanine carboxypeptidase/D-alanyl-D-alanine-endopeptidase [Gammaproteobacteria bacterium]
MFNRLCLFFLFVVCLLTANAEDVPSTVDLSEAALPVGIRSVLNVRQLPANSLSIYVENLDSGEVLLDWRADVPRNPASVMKLLTTLVALDTLGPTYRWKTDTYIVGDINGDTLEGDLLLKGYGDPFLVTERVWQMLRELRRSGIRRITGNLLLDDSYFRVTDEDPAAFDHEPLRAYNVIPNALMMNFKAVRYYFSPDVANNKVIVAVDPALDNLKIVNRLSVSNASCRGYQRGIAIIPNPSFDQVTFRGEFPSGCDIYSMDRAALRHNEFSFGLFKSIWEESGGEILGSWRNVVSDGEVEPFLSFASWPLADVISRVNKYSNNVMARQLLYTLGAEVYGPPGTEENGRRAILQWLDREGFDAAELSLDNGAGLSRTSRMTARQLAGLLRYAYKQSYMPEFLSSMSISGLDGTLSRRFRNDILTGKAHIKTGTLDHVTAIAGYVQSRSGDRYAVVALQNHEDIHRGPGEEVQEALLRWVYMR